MRSHGLCRATVTVGVLVLAGALAHAADVVIDFENLPPNTILSTQYHGLGVDFSPSHYGDAGLPYIDTDSGAPSGTHIANIRNCSGEFCPSAIYGKFTVTRRHVGMWVKNLRTDGSSVSTTLTAFGIGGETLTSATTAVVAGGPWVFLEVDRPDAVIDAFDLRGQGFTARLAIDDLTYDLPDVPPPPDFGLTREGPLGDGVRQGASASATIAINRVNGSTGNISFVVSGLPAGVTAEVAPNPAAGTSVVVTFTASASAPAVSGTLVTITGTPANAGVGSDPRSLSFSLTVASNFAIAPATVDVPPCTTKASPIQVFVPYTLGSPWPGLIPSTFAGTVTLSVSTSLPTGVSVSFVPSSVTLLDGLSATSSMRISAALGSLTGDLTVGVRLTSPPYPDATGLITIHPIAGNVDSFTPLTGNEPQALRPGTDVTIRGAGFCTGSPITVQFGNSLATAAVTSVSLDGKEIHASVPRLATDGPLTITTSVGSFSSSTAFKVQSFRSLNGYSFTNPALPDASFDDLVATFGRDQTYLGVTIDPCAALTAGLGHCPIVSFDITPNPFAWLFAKAVSNKVDAHCFGMSYTAERFIKGQDAYAAFPPGTADTTWGLLGPSEPSSTLLNHLRVRHFYQFDARVVRHYLQHAANIWASSSTYASEVPEIRDSIRSELLAGNYPLVMMRSGGGGHVVLAYDIEDVATNDFYIDIYDPNVPFRDAERTNSAAHKQAEQDKSRIHVTADGRWTYPGLGGWGPAYFHSKGYTLVVVPFSLIPSSSPILPTTLDGLTSLAFGSVSVTQISDATGHSLNQEDGSLNTDPTTRLETAVPYTLFDAPEAEVSSNSYALTGAGPYTVTLTGTQPGEYSYYAVSGVYGLSLKQVSTKPTTKDRIVLDSSHRGFAFATNDVSKPLAVDLGLASAPNGVYRTISLSTTVFSGEGDRLSYDSLTHSVSYRHHGSPTLYTIALSQTGAAGLPGMFQSETLTISDEETATFLPSDWGRLGDGSVELTVSHANGTVEKRRLTSATPPSVELTALGAIVNQDGSLDLTISSHGSQALTGTTVVYSWVVGKGNAVLGQNRLMLPGGQVSGQSRVDHWSFTPGNPGIYAFTGSVTVVRGGFPPQHESQAKSLSLLIQTTENGQVKVTPVLMGDVLGDGEITVQDAVYVLDVVAGRQTLSAQQSLVADVNGDGLVDVQDAVAILSKLVGPAP